MAQHVRMNREGQFGQLPSPADHFEKPGPRHWAAAFCVEDIAALLVLASQLAQCPDFLASRSASSTALRSSVKRPRISTTLEVMVSITSRTFSLFSMR